MVPVAAMALLLTSAAASISESPQRVAVKPVKAPPRGPAPVKIKDNETVYALLDQFGGVTKTIVVDWLQLTGTGKARVFDPGRIDKVQSLTKGFAPSGEGGGVNFTTQVRGRKDLFYRATTDKKLPVEIEVAYFLDGEEIEPVNLAGRSGRLRIDITARNRLKRTRKIRFEGADGSMVTKEKTYWVPMLVSAQVKLDGTKFSNVKADNAPLSITGTNMQYMLSMFPQDEATATIEMDGRDIELDPMTIVVFPRLLGAPSIEIAGQLDKARDGAAGLAKLSAGHIAILDALIGGFDVSQLDQFAGTADDFTALMAGLEELEKGTGDMVLLAEGQKAYLDGLIAGIDTSEFDSIGQLVTAIDDTADGVEQTADGVAGVLQMLDGQIALLEQAKTSNESMLAMANDRAAAYPADTTMTALASDLAAQDSLLETALAGGQLGGEDFPGLYATRASLASISDALTITAAGLNQIATEAQMLNAVPAAFKDLKSALVVLRDGGTIQGQALPGLGTTVDGLAGIRDGLGVMNAGMAGSSDMLADLESAPEQLKQLFDTLEALKSGGTLMGTYVPGANTTEQGLTMLSDGLGEGVDEARAGEKLLDLMKASADSYDTFLGKPKGASGNVNFILKLEGIEK